MELISSAIFSQLRNQIARSDSVSDGMDGIRDRLFRLAYALTLDYALAEDLAQDSMIRVWQNRDRLAQVDSVEAWLTTIVLNRARSYWKRRKSWLPFTGKEVAPGEQDPEIIALRQAMAELEPDLRDVALLIGVYGASYAEVALALNLSEGTVGSRYNRAKVMLRTRLGEGL